MRVTSRLASPSLLRPCGSSFTAAGWLAAQPFLAARRAQSSLNHDKPYYVTTPIFYVNAAPHVGHLWSMVLADIFKRWQQLKGRKAVLCTGVDEHGMKVQRAALRANSEPKAFCDQGAEMFQSLAASADISNDHFVRTTDEQHKEAVQHAWTILQQKDLIYVSKHEGWYSISDETFYPSSAVQLIVDPPTGRKIMVSVETGKEVEWTSEVNYRFRLSMFKDQLLQFYEDNPNFIVPANRMKEIVQAVSSGLEDLSVSRPSSRLTWGIPVPGDDSQTIYVWVDALLNYITKIGYPWSPSQDHMSGWPADVQVIGKDITRFHAIYWPAILFALSLPPPQRLVAHAHWTLGHEKMAKSTGNVVNPFFAIDRFGIDTIRYYLALEGGLSQDSDYGNESIIAAYKKGLQWGLGNLSSRVLRGKGWNVRRAVEHGCTPEGVEKPMELDDASLAQAEMLRTVAGNVDECFLRSDAGAALKTIMNVVYATNAYLQHAQPWSLSPNPPATPNNNPNPTPFIRPLPFPTKLDTTIFLAAEAIRIVAILLQPYMPAKAAELLEMLGVEDGERRGFEYAVLGRDGAYGVPRVDLGRGLEGALFLPLIVEE